MKKTVTKSDFIDAFIKMKRYNTFSYNGKSALFNYLEQLEAETDTEIELDVIAICCQYTEYENISEYNKVYDTNCETIEEIEEHTTVIRIDDSFIIKDY